MSAAPTLVPAGLRRPVAAATLVAATLFTALAVRYAGTSAASRLDLHVDTVVDPLGAAPHRLAEGVSTLGSPSAVAVLAAGLAAVFLLLRRPWEAGLAVAGPGLTGVATTLLKPAIDRTIVGGGYAFPSGHTGGATALGLVVALLVVGTVRPGRAGGLAILAAGALIGGAAVGVAMVATDAHYPTDTVGGFCVALTLVLGVALLLDALRARAVRT